METSLIVADRIELRKSRGDTGGGPEVEPEGLNTLTDLLRLRGSESVEVCEHAMAVSERNHIKH